MKKIGVIGLWHQGVVGAACMADLGYNVIAADHDEKRIKELKAGKAPLFEPGLDDLIKKGLQKEHLSFTSNIPEAVIGQKEVMIMFDVPVDENDKSNLSELLNTIDEIIPYLENESVLYITAQVPAGTCHEVIRRIRAQNPNVKCDVAYSPENLRLGQAIERFLHPALPVIGADDQATFDRIEDLLSPLDVEWRHTNLSTSEMTKHALNAYLALSISFGNELGNLCDEVGADGHRIAEVLRMEPRIGREAMLFPGLGFSGATLARDIQTLRSLCDESGLDSILLDAVWEANNNQNKLVIRKLNKIYKSIDSLRITVLGLTYKPNTSTLRRSAALEIINDMVKEGAIVSGHDPRADRLELSRHTELIFKDDLYEAAEGANALVLITPWEDYIDIDFNRIRQIMEPEPVIIDTSNLWDANYLEEMGFLYRDIGKGREARGKP
jgi:UDPglucose 6-dehydrogenase